MGRLAPIDAGQLAEFVHEFVAAAHGAAQGAAHPDVVLARRVLTQAGIEGHDFLDLDRFDLEFAGHPFDRFRRNESKLGLDNVEQGKDCGALAILRVMLDALVSLLLDFLGDLKRRMVLRSAVWWEATCSLRMVSDMGMMRAAKKRRGKGSLSVTLAHDKVEGA